jgi:DNA gyrase subunit A
VSVSEFLGLSKEEFVLTVFEINETNSLAIGTKDGVVKRVLADYPVKDEFEVIALKDGDRVIGAALASDSDELVFVTNDAQLLRFPATSVRPQGRPAGGVAGINLAEDAFAIGFFVAPTANDYVAFTAANSSEAIPGTDSGSAKTTPLDEFPAKGRATGGVRAQRFVRGEDQLYFAWVGPAEALGLTVDGKPIELSSENAKRDASGSHLSAVIGSVGTR